MAAVDGVRPNLRAIEGPKEPLLLPAPRLANLDVDTTAPAGNATVPVFAAQPGADLVAIAKTQLAHLDPAAIAKAKAALADIAQKLASGNALSSKTAQRLQKSLIEQVIKLDAVGKLEEAIAPIALPALAKLQPKATNDDRLGLISQFATMVHTQLSQHGLAVGSEGKRYVTWEEIGARHLARLRTESCSIDSPEFQSQLERILGKPFVPGDAQLLVNGPASFAVRDQLIDAANDSIQYMTWAFYDDATADGQLEKLKAARDRGVDVTILVDDETANQPAHARFLKKIIEAGFPVARVRGHHRKMLIVDGKAVVMGGLNVGDIYSHRGAAANDPKQQWRDTDVLLHGPASVEQAFDIIDSLWRQFGPKDHPLKRPVFSGMASSGAQVAVVDDAPGIDDNDPIFLGLLKAIDSCRKPEDGPIDIENAYFLLSPAMRTVIREARERGVQVRVLSNSPESVDVPLISAPIMKSLREMAEIGCEVYLKQGATLHSKFAAVGKRFATVGSYNLHPDSVRFKGESNAFVLDEQFASDVHTQFEKDIAAATRLDLSKLPPEEPNALLALLEPFYYDFL